MFFSNLSSSSSDPFSLLTIWYQTTRSIDPYPLHYAYHTKSDDLVNPNFHMMLDEMQRIKTQLSEKIEGHCSGLEKCVGDLDQRSEERFISLEMARTEVETERVDMDKQFTSLKLEVGRINRFLERENLVKSQSKPGIIRTTESAGHIDPYV
jgi:hypothetical protein